MIRAPLFESLLRPGALQVRFQPVLDLRGSRPRPVALAAEVAGPIGSNLERSRSLVEFGRRLRRESELDRAAIRAVLAEARQAPESLGVHVEVHATTLAGDGFVAFLRGAARESGVALERLTLAIVEHAMVNDRRIQECLGELRAAGVEIALAETGSGSAPSGFRTVLLFRPALLKADLTSARGLDGDRQRQASLRAVRQLAGLLGARWAATGVERESDRQVLGELGADFAQGPLFGRSMPLETLLAAGGLGAGPAAPPLAAYSAAAIAGG